MFRSIGKWMTCAVLLSFGLFAQETDTTSQPPIEVKEQKGEVLGSLGRTVDKLVPSVNVEMGLHTKQYKSGVLWDKNINADMDVTFSWMPVQNGILSIGLNGRIPLEDSKKYVRERYEWDTYFGNYRDNRKIGIDKFRDEDWDEIELRVLYSHKFKDVIPYINEINISGGWSYYKLNDIYSQIYYKNSEGYYGNNVEYSEEDVRITKWRDTERHEFKLSLSLDNILKSDTYNLTPNMSFNLETTGHFWMQYGVKFDMPVNAISRKLKWKNSIDTYWFDKNYFEVKQEYRPSLEKESEPSKAGFKTLNIQTSLEYAFNDKFSISPYISAIWYYDNLLSCGSRDEEFYLIVSDITAWCGVYLTLSF